MNQTTSSQKNCCLLALDFDVVCRGFALVRHFFVLDDLPLGEILESGSFDGGDVNEDIFATAVLWLNEPVSLFSVEPFHRAAQHSRSSKPAVELAYCGRDAIVGRPDRGYRMSKYTALAAFSSRHHPNPLQGHSHFAAARVNRNPTRIIDPDSGADDRCQAHRWGNLRSAWLHRILLSSVDKSTEHLSLALCEVMRKE
jgi:hypothetical protein